MANRYRSDTDTAGLTSLVKYVLFVFFIYLYHNCNKLSTQLLGVHELVWLLDKMLHFLYFHFCISPCMGEQIQRTNLPKKTQRCHFEDTNNLLPD